LHSRLLTSCLVWERITLAPAFTANYVVTVHLKAEKLDNTGFVKDYRALSMVKEYIDNHLDHRHLNDVISGNPTAENIAYYLFSIFKSDIPELYAVEVSETPKTSAIYDSGC